MAIFSSFSPEERRVLWLTCPTHFCCHFFILVFPAATIPMGGTLGMPLEQVVKLSFPMYLMYGLFSLPVGLIVDRWGAKWMLVIGQLLVGLGLILTGSFPTPDRMWLALGVVGIGASVYHPAGMSLISKTIERRGFALGINGVWGNLGIASAPLVTGVLTWQLGWQSAFIVLGVLALLVGGLLATLRVNEKSFRAAPPTRAPATELTKYFLILCVALICGGLAYRGNMILLPAYLEIKTSFFANAIASLSFLRTQGTANLAATVLTSCVLLAGIFGQMFGGRLADRMDLRRAYLLIHASSLPFILLMAVATDQWLAIVASIYIFFSLGMQPIENSLIAAITPTRWRSTSFAVKFILNFGIGSAVVYLIEPVKNAFSLETVYLFLSLSTAMLVGSILWLVLASRSVVSVRN